MIVNCPKCMVSFENQESLEKHIESKHEGFTVKAFPVLLFQLYSDLDKYEKAQTYGDSAIAISAYLRDLIKKL